MEAHLISPFTKLLEYVIPNTRIGIRKRTAINGGVSLYRYLSLQRNNICNWTERPGRSLSPCTLCLVSQQFQQAFSCRSANVGRYYLGHFLSKFLFYLGYQCCDALDRPCSESFSSLPKVLLPWRCRPFWYELCLKVCLPVHSLWFRHGSTVDPHQSLQPKAVHDLVSARAAHPRLSFV